jgi:hydrogenase nickel incorporation protein HypA/HybF
MHEMSIAVSLVEIIQQEMAKHGVSTLLKVRVKHGRLTHLVPEALHFAFEACVRDTDMEGAELELEEVPLSVRCCKCAAVFEPDQEDIVYLPCPECGEEFGHEVLTGKELHLDRLEAE